MAVISSEENMREPPPHQGGRPPAGRPARPLRGRGGGAGARGQGGRCSSPATSTRPRSARQPDGDGVGARAGHRRRTRRRSGASTAWSLLLVPSLNPDGQIMETEWYRKHLGTRYEGGRMPWLYHHYVGHDNNRDWFMLTQKETRAMTRAVYHEWFPQVWLDEHQMGATGPRIFVPPFADPVDTDIHPLVWREVNLIGAHMALRLEQAGKSGVIYGYSYDAYWPGGTMNTGLVEEHLRPADRSGLGAHGHAGAHRAGRAVGRAQGARRLRARRPTSPTPGRAGWWRLRDIMDYERIASDALLEACGRTTGEDFLRNALARARAASRPSAPSDAYRIPATQRDRRRRAPAGRADGRARRRGEAGRGRRRLDPARPALRPLRAGDVRAPALSGGAAGGGPRHRAAVRRLGLDPAADDGRGASSARPCPPA